MNAQLEQSLRTVLPESQILTDPAEIIPYETDSMPHRGIPDAVVFPRSVQDVCRIARWASSNRLPIVGRGAGTGRSGGAVAEHGGIVVAFSQMDRLVEFDRAGRMVVIEPGMVNENLDARLRTEGLFYPPDPSSGRVATLGGNVSENAGGPHCFKYGVTTAYVLELEVVLADGRIVHLGGSALDPPGYDLIGLFTGSEGTLGLLTSIRVQLRRSPPEVKTMMAAFDSIDEAGNAVSAVIAAGLVPATLEMMDQQIMRLIEEYAHPGLPVNAGAMLIVEVDGYPASLDGQIEEVRRILERKGAYGLKVARTASERNAIWYGRKSAGGAFPHYTVDCTVPRSQIAETLAAMNGLCGRLGLRVGHVFHAGDGNLHPCILTDPANPEQIARVSQAAAEILQEVVSRGGAISGEHGIGIEKRAYMPLMFNASELAALQDVKRAFDPENLLNPGKVLPLDMPAFSPPTPSDEIPGSEFSPATAEQAAAGLAALSRLGRRVVINGKSEGAASLSTRKLAGIKTYAPDDLYVTAGAGTRLDDIQARLRGEGRRVALAAPWPEATIGGLVAANINSPQRLLYGAVRDQVLAATVVLADGRILRAGRPVVKNVAGYDLPKVLIGSYGTLGLLADVTLKLVPIARRKLTLLVGLDDQSQAVRLSAQLLWQALVASAIVIVKGGALSELPSGRYVLAYTAEGLDKDVEAETSNVRAILQAAGGKNVIERDELTGTDIWGKLLSDSGPGHAQIRVGVAVKHLAAFIAEQARALDQGSWLVDAANGLIYASIELRDLDAAQRWIGGLRQAAVSRDGYAVVTAMPQAWSGRVDRWGGPPGGIELMRALKKRWDPAGILGTGTFITT